MKIILVLMAACLTPIALAQTPAPASQGVLLEPAGVVELGPEIEGMAGRQLRARRITVAPGGSVALHHHRDRPSAEILIEGRLVELRNGVAIEYGPGAWIFSDKTTSHSWENRGKVAAVLVAVDIVKP